jgi:DNA-binding ferritin-like protein (Dps family)
MAEEISLEEYKKVYREIRTYFLGHVAVLTCWLAMAIIFGVLSYHLEVTISWSGYLILGCGAGILMHFSSVRCIEKISLEEYKKVYREIRRYFLGHVALLTCWLTIGIIIDLVLYYHLEVTILAHWHWSGYLISGCGASILMHFGSVRRIEKSLKNKETEAEYRVRESKKK